MINDVVLVFKSTVMEGSTKDLGRTTNVMAETERKKVLMAAYIVAILKMIREMDKVLPRTLTVVLTVEHGSMASGTDTAQKLSQMA